MINSKLFPPLIMLSFLILACSSQDSVERSVKVTSVLSRQTQSLANSCQEIQDREQRDYQFNWNPYINLQEGYRVHRIGSTYNIHFKMVTRSFSPNENNVYEYKKLPQVLSKKWRMCLSQINDNLEYNGKTIRLYLEEYSHKRDMPYMILVNENTDLSESDQMWLLRKNCSQLIKLTFLGLGLVDEKSDSAFSCRARSPKSSVMNDPNEALYKIKRTGYEFVTYRCECDSHQFDNCAEILSGADESWGEKGSFSCPEKSHLIKKYFLKNDLWQWGQAHQGILRQVFSKPFDQMTMEEICQGYSRQKGQHRYCKTLAQESLLMPGQFKALLHPHCASQNKTYVKCSQQAYLKKACPVDPQSGQGCFALDGSWLK